MKRSAPKVTLQVSDWPMIAEILELDSVDAD
jgi:hypothetical protein